MLSTLPQGDAKQATLEIRERVARTKAKAKPKANVGEDIVPVAKRQKTLVELFHKPRHVSEPGGGKHIEPVVSEHGGGDNVAPSASEHGGGIEGNCNQSKARLTTPSADLFVQDM